MTWEQMLARAAETRRGQTAAPADRPRQRRCAEESSARAYVRLPAQVELREPGEDGRLHFHGVASATERGYEMWDWAGPYTEIVDAGAFDTTLRREGLDVPLVLAHDSLRRIARTLNGSLTLEATADGLVVDAPSLDPRDADVAYIEPKLRAGLIDEMSFAFRIVAGEWSPNWDTYRITEVDLHRGDVAIVGYGANPHTSAELRAAQPAPDLRAALLAVAIAI